MKTHHDKNLGIMTYIIISCYVVWYFFYYIRETLYKMKQEGKLKNLIPKLQGFFAGLIALFVITSLNFLDIIIAKETFFCQEGFILIYIYSFILFGWFLSKVYLETEKEQVDFINNLQPALISVFLFHDIVYTVLF